MNQKDYKAIAEIMRKRHLDSDTEDCADEVKGLCYDLADYFEGENKRIIQFMKDNPRTFEKGEIDTKSFHKEQFLKDCGIEVEK